MPTKREEKLIAERFRRRLEKKLGECVTLPFGREIWEYRSLVEKKKTRRLNRILTRMTEFAKGKTVFPYPTKPEEFMKECDDSDSSYGRDESVLFEGYYIEEKIYTGSPGVKIYLCEKSIYAKKLHNSQVCVKIVNLKKTFDDYVDNYLKKELDVILQVKHPFIIETLCVLYRKKQYFIFMRYAERRDLFAYLVNYGAVTENRSKIWSAQLGSALSFLHSLEIAHTDVCCENILVTQNFNLKLTDFECAVRVKYEMGKALPVNDYRGSAEYASPEILQGRPYSATGADTWALAVILYVMLTTNLPFSGQTNEELLASQRSWKMKELTTLSRDLAILFHKMFQYKSKRRYTLERFLHSDWFLKDSRLSEVTGQRVRPEKGESRPTDDPGRMRLVDDPGQEQADGEAIRFQPFLKQKPSETNLLPLLLDEGDLEETISDDQSYGIPFKPGEEQARQLYSLEKLWKLKKHQKKKCEDADRESKKNRKTGKLLCKAYKAVVQKDTDE